LTGHPQIDPGDFNPFEEFHGAWTTELAEIYAPRFNRMFGRWESVSGRLVVAPFEAAYTSWGKAALIELLGRRQKRPGISSSPVSTRV